MKNASEERVSHAIMDIKSIRYFVHCAEVRSLTAAARDLAVAQPALTRRIHRLEEEFGVRLFDRQPRGVSLTPAGETFLEHCRRILREVSLADQAISLGAARGRQVFSLGLPGTCAATLVPALIDGLRPLLPRLHINISEGTTPALIDGLTARRLDFAVLQDPPTSSLLQVTPHLVEKLVVVMVAEQAPADGSIGLEELVRLPLVLTKGILQLVNEQIRATGCQISAEYTISSPQAIRTLVLRGMAATIMPTSTFQHDITSRRMRVQTVNGVNLRRTLTTAQLADGPRPGLGDATAAVRATLDMLARDGHFDIAQPHCKSALALVN